MSKFQKGDPRPPNAGRKPGSKNKMTQKAFTMMCAFAESHMTEEKLEELYALLKPNERASFLTKMWPYMFPTMKEHTMDSGTMTRERAKEILTALISREEDGRVDV